MAAMPVAVAWCVIDAMVCIVYLCWLEWWPKFFMSSHRNVHQNFHIFKFCSWDSDSAFVSGTKFFT